MAGCGNPTCKVCDFYRQKELGEDSTHWGKLLLKAQEKHVLAKRLIGELKQNPRPSGKDFLKIYNFLLKLPCSADALLKVLWDHLKLYAKEGGTYRGKSKIEDFSDIAKWYPSGAVRLCPKVGTKDSTKFQGSLGGLEFNHRVSGMPQKRKAVDEAVQRRSQRTKRSKRKKS